jgi:hypothetical protein
MLNQSLKADTALRQAKKHLAVFIFFIGRLGSRPSQSSQRLRSILNAAFSSRKMSIFA